MWLTDREALKDESIATRDRVKIKFVTFMMRQPIIKNTYVMYADVSCIN